MALPLPSPGLIRQQLRVILQEQILPEVRQNPALRMMVAQFPLAPPPGVTLRDLAVPPLQESAATDEYPLGLRWPEEGVHAIQFPVLCCVFAGEIDLRLGITEFMLRGQPRPRQQSGLCVVSLPSPSFLVIPAGVPYSTGSTLPWERAEQQQVPAYIFWVRVLPNGALCHTTTVFDGRQEPLYSLLIEDDLLSPMLRILEAALHPVTGDQEMAQAQLRVLLVRLLQNLHQTMPMITDGIHSRFPAGKGAVAGVGVDGEEPQTAGSPLLVKACNYIQFHLHEPLTPVSVAHHIRLKPAQLNRIFRQHLEMSVMRYVVQQRMSTAQLLLRSSDLSVQEIGKLVGYKHASHFSRTFTGHAGMAPLKFRQTQPAIES